MPKKTDNKLRSHISDWLESQVEKSLRTSPRVGAPNEAMPVRQETSVDFARPSEDDIQEGMLKTDGPEWVEGTPLSFEQLEEAEQAAQTVLMNALVAKGVEEQDALGTVLNMMSAYAPEFLQVMNDELSARGEKHHSIVGLKRRLEYLATEAQQRISTDSIERERLYSQQARERHEKDWQALEVYRDLVKDMHGHNDDSESEVE